MVVFAVCSALPCIFFLGVAVAINFLAMCNSMLTRIFDLKSYRLNCQWSSTLVLLFYEAGASAQFHRDHRVTLACIKPFCSPGGDFRALEAHGDVVAWNASTSLKPDGSVVTWGRIRSMQSI